MADEVKQKHPGGRPLKYTPDEIESKINDYFVYCKKNDEIPDIEGLAYFLDTTRKTLLDYESKDEYSYTIKKAKTRIAYEKKQLALKGKIPPAIFCFDFKNNHEYADKQEISTPPGQPIEINSGLKGASDAELQEILRFVRQQTAEKH